MKILIALLTLILILITTTLISILAGFLTSLTPKIQEKLGINLVSEEFKVMYYGTIGSLYTLLILHLIKSLLQ